MAYKSRVSNKYMGATFAGQVQAANTSETEDLIRTLQKDVNPTLERIYNKEVTKKQDTAKSKINELYASGKSSEDISAEILEGKHPELSGRYVEKIVSQEQGKLSAIDSIAKIEANKDKYDFKETNLAAFYKEYLPSFPDKDGAFALGFASVFNDYKAKQAIKDGQIRNQYAETKKLEDGAKILSSSNTNDYWDTVKSLVVQVPPEEGSTQKRYIRTFEQANKSAMLHLTSAIDTATTTAELGKIEDIIRKDRGTGVGGNPLGSLYDNRNKAENAALVKKLEDKKRTISSYEYTQANRIKQEEKHNLLKNIFSIDKEQDKVGYENAVKEAVKKYPSLASTINATAKSNAELFENSEGIANLKRDVMLGNYNYNTDKLREEWSTLSNNFSTYDKLVELQIASQIRESNGYVSPFKETQFVNTTKEITDFITKAVSPYSKKYEGQQNAFVAKIITNEIGDLYINWLAENPKPSRAAAPTVKNKWEDDQRKFFEKTYTDTIKKYNTETYLKGLGVVLDKSTTGLTTSTNLKDLRLNYLETSSIKNAKKYEPFVEDIKTQSDLNLINPVDMLMQSKDFQNLMKKEKLEGDTAGQRAYATRMINELGIKPKDYTDEINSLFDTISSNVENFTLPPIETYTPLGLVEKGASVENQRNFFLNTLETITGRTITKDLYDKVLNTASKEALAQAFNINTMQLDKLVDEYLK